MVTSTVAPSGVVAEYLVEILLAVSQVRLSLLLRLPVIGNDCLSAVSIHLIGGQSSHWICAAHNSPLSRIEQVVVVTTSRVPLWLVAMLLLLVVVVAVVLFPQPTAAVDAFWRRWCYD